MCNKVVIWLVLCTNILHSTKQRLVTKDGTFKVVNTTLNVPSFESLNR